jgi:predicted RNase H-like HicB family nuclease
VTEYTVQAKRAGEYWELHIDGVGVTQSRNLGTDADEMIRSYITTTTGKPADLFTYAVVPKVAVSTYRVIARRVGGWWALEVPELPGVFSQVGRLDGAEGAAREAIALMLGVDADTVSVDVEASG